MKRFLSWLVVVPVALLLIGFAVANREWVSVSLDPLDRTDPWLTVSMPLFVLLFVGVLAGLVAGWLAAWFGQARWRKAARQARYDLEAARLENARLVRTAAAARPEQP